MFKKIIASLLSAVLLAGSISMPEPVYGQTNSDTVEITSEENISVQGNNSFGNLLTDSINEKMDEEEQNDGCNIFAAEISGTEAAVDFESTADAVLVVAIYDEAGTKLTASGKIEVQAGETQTQVSIDTEEMPQYFYLRCFLVDSETLMPLCTVYESPNYTQEMQEFLAKTTEDFEPEQVVNLDEDTTNNFVVCGEDTVMIPKSEGENLVTETDEENNRYVIEQIDETVASLKQGDIFVYEYGENEILVLKVGTIQIDGDTAVITGAGTSMEEVFSYVKIDSESTSEDAVVDASGMEEGVSFEGLVEYEEDEIQPYAWEGGGNKSFALSYKFADAKIGSDNNSIKLSGSLDLKLEASLKFYISLEYHYLELKIDYSGKLGIALSGNASGKV